MAHALRAAVLLALAAACTAVAGLADAELLPVRIYTKADGLPHERVKRIVEDHRGFLWFATTDGLARFDGRRFVTYGVAEGLPVPSVNDLLETPEGCWVATNGGGIAFFAPDAAQTSFRVIHVGDGAPDRVNALACDARGVIWAATDGGLFRLTCTPGGEVGHVEPVQLGLAGHPDPSVQVASLLETEHGMLAGTRYGLVLLGGGPPRRIQLTAAGEESVLTLARVPGGEVLVGAGDVGLLRLDPSTLAVTGTMTVADGLPDPTITAMLVSRDRWVLGTLDGLAVVQQGRVKAYGVANGLPSARFSAVAEDRDGSIWLGTPALGGVAQVDLGGSAFFGRADGLGQIVSELFERRSGELCILSSDWTVSRYDGTRLESVRLRLPDGLQPKEWRVYHGTVEDRERMFWFATPKGVYRFGPIGNLEELAHCRPNAHLTTADGLATNEVSKLFADSRGDIWIGTFLSVREPLCRWRRATGKIERFAVADGLPSLGAPYVFAEDAAGDVWISYRGGVLVRYRDGRFDTMTGKRGFPTFPVRAMASDARGRLWATTAGGGLLRVDRPADPAPSAVTFGPEQGIGDFYLGDLLCDGNGKIVIATSQKLLSFDPARAAVAAEWSAGAMFPAEPVKLLRDRTGTLWIGSSQGLARITQASERSEGRVRVLVSGVEVSGTTRSSPGVGASRLELGELPAESNLAISFFALGRFGKPVAYEHRLDGLDRRWSAPTEAATVQYGRLGGGSYRFRVRAAASHQGETAEAAVSFVVLPPIWRRGWFIAGIGLLVAALGYGTATARARRQRALADVRSRIASDLHDDLGGSLSRIAILSDVAARAIRGNDSPGEAVSKISEASRAVGERLADGIWAVDPRRDDLQSLVERLRLVAHETLDPAAVAWRVEVSDGADRLRLHPGRRREIYLLLKEAITNAARHSGARHVSLDVVPSRGRLRFELRDDGCGFEPALVGGVERLAGGRGLANMRRRADVLGGTLQIESASAAGTVVRLEVPLRGGA